MVPISSSLAAFKLGCTVFVVLLSVLGGIIPLKLRDVHYEKFLPFLNCFAGGLFVGAGFLHMVPNAQRDVGQYLSSTSGLQHSYPFASLGAVVGLLLVFFVERGLLAAAEPKPVKSVASPVSGGYARVANPAIQAQDFGTRWGSHIGDRPVLPYLLAIVFSLHSFIAGAAFGLQGSYNQSVILLIVLIGHKLIEAMAFGTVFVKARTPRGNFIRVFAVYTCMMPLGVLVGVICAQLIQSQQSLYFLVQGLMESVAAGTYIYVSLMGILVFEFESFDLLAQKMASVTLGIVVMAVIAVWY